MDYENDDKILSEDVSSKFPIEPTEEEKEALKTQQDASEEAPKDELAEETGHIVERALKRISEIDGLITPQIITDSFHDRNEKGKLTTVMQMKLQYLNADELATEAENPSIRESVRATSMDAEISIEEAAGFSTLVLTFAHGSRGSMNRIWYELLNYGDTNAKLTGESEEIPVMTITAVPMILGGQYAMIASEPIFWCLQSTEPNDTMMNQIRILFKPETIVFMRDVTFTTEQVYARVKSEIAAEALIEEAIARKELEKEQDKKEYEDKIAEYTNSNLRGYDGFKTSGLKHGYGKDIGHGEEDEEDEEDTES